MWRYQLVKHKDRVELVEIFDLAEPKILKSGELTLSKKRKIAYTDNILADVYEDEKDITRALRLMLKDIKNYGVIDKEKLKDLSTSKRKSQKRH